MADWTNIVNSALDPDAPLTSELAYAWRDNPIAITEGATGAPRIVDGAMGTSATNTGRNWVNDRHALSVAGAVGTYAMCLASGAVGNGSTVAGSTLSYSNAAGTIGGSPASLAGTWRCMGRAVAGTATSLTTLFLRIS